MSEALFLLRNLGSGEKREMREMVGISLTSLGKLRWEDMTTTGVIEACA